MPAGACEIDGNFAGSVNDLTAIAVLVSVIVLHLWGLFKNQNHANKV